MCRSHHVRAETGGTTGLLTTRRMSLTGVQASSTSVPGLNRLSAPHYFLFLNGFFQNHPYFRGCTFNELLNGWGIYMYGPNANNNEFMINFLLPFLAGQIAIRFVFSLSLSISLSISLSLSLLQHTLQSLAVSLR